MIFGILSEPSPLLRLFFFSSPFTSLVTEILDACFLYEQRFLFVLEQRSVESCFFACLFKCLAIKWGLTDVASSC